MLNPYAMAAHFKHLGVKRQESWSRWVQVTSLRPGMDAKDWYKIFDAAEACPLPTQSHREINATHFDTVRQCDVEIKEDERGIFNMHWADGGYGSNPPCEPPSPDRFIPK